jgi:hypothetical protein
MAKQVEKAVESTKSSSTAVAVPGNPWSQLAHELEKVIGVQIVKFTKQGEYAISETDLIPEGTRVVARVDLAQTGWVKWVDGAKVDTAMGAVADKFVPPARTSLDDADRSSWEDPDRDPWQFNMEMPVTRLDTDETFKFTTGSKGGMNALGKLIRVFGTRLEKGQTGLPICVLKAGSYKHHEYGKIFYPVFEIVNWTDDGGKPMPVDKDLNDSIPF